MLYGESVSTQQLDQPEDSEPLGKMRIPPAVIAGFCGWLLDAFDFFLVTLCLTSMARDFQKSDAQIALIITMTLAFRPVGGFIFGIMADRYGRRLPLMINIGLFAVAELLTGMAANYTMLLLVRGMFGIACDGGCADRETWNDIRIASGGLCCRKCACSAKLLLPFWSIRLAATVLSRKPASHCTGSVHPLPS